MDIESACVEDLVARAERIRFYVGDPPETATHDTGHEPGSAMHRLQTAQRALSDICFKHPAAQALLDLRQGHPELFAETGPASFNMAEQLAMLKAYTNTIPTFQSQLSLAQDLRVPALESFTSLASMRPDLEKVEKEYQALLEEVASLRRRSAVLLRRWYEVAVLGGGDCWVEWERRLEVVEREIRRQEVLRQEEATA